MAVISQQKQLMLNSHTPFPSPPKSNPIHFIPHVQYFQLLQLLTKTKQILYILQSLQNRLFFIYNHGRDIILLKNLAYEFWLKNFLTLMCALYTQQQNEDGQLCVECGVTKSYMHKHHSYIRANI